MENIPVKIKLLSETAKMPFKAHVTDAGIDLFSNNEDIITIEAKDHAKIPLGFAMSIPDGYCAVIKDRSGLALKNRICTRAGVIDSSYRGEVSVILENNMSDTIFYVENGMKIAQMLILPVPKVTIQEVKDLGDTDRGSGGFGSTGV